MAMQENGARDFVPRSSAWAGVIQRDDHRALLELVVGDLDENDLRYNALVRSVDKRLQRIERRNLWVLGVVVSILAALVGNLIVLAVTL